MTADLVFLEGSVLTMDADASVATALAVTNGEITFVGSDHEVRDLIGASTRVENLHGRTLLPGINDSHMHVAAFGRSQLELNCSGDVAPSIADIANIVAQATKTATPGTWIRGNGWDLGSLAECQADPERMPTRHDLDAVSPDHPVFLQDFSGHLTWVNSKALEVAQVGRTAVAPVGSVIYRDADDLPSGLFSEGAQALIHQALPPLTHADIIDAITYATSLLHAEGITNWTEPGLGPGGAQIFQGAMGEPVLNAYLELARANRLQTRMGVLWMPCDMAGSASMMAKNLADIGLPADLDPRIIRLLGVKIFGDGIPPNKTAWMKDEYEGGGHGSLCVHGNTHEERAIELTEMVRLAHTAGHQVGVHVTGDMAIETVVDAFVAAERSLPRGDARHYIIHGDFISAENIHTMAKYGYGLNMNPGVKYLITELMDEMMGLDRSTYQWPVADATRAGIAVCSSSDAPVTLPNWRLAVSAMMLRESKHSGKVSGPEQCVSLTTALRAYTTAPARQDFAQDWKGTLEVGKVADLCVLDGDIVAADPHDIPSMNVDMTVFDGDVVFSR